MNLPEIGKGRLDFSGNAEQNTQPPLNETQTEHSADTGKVFDLPPKRETRSRRIILLLRPSVYDKFRLAAAKQGRSFNDLANSLFELYISQQADA